MVWPSERYVKTSRRLFHFCPKAVEREREREREFVHMYIYVMVVCVPYISHILSVIVS